MSLSSPLITDSVIQASHWLQKGQLLVYPTESVWGIGCDPFNQQAVMQLLTIKQRPIEKGMIVVTDSPSRITALLDGLSIAQRQNVLDSWQTDSINGTAKQAHTWLLPISHNLPISIPSWITGAHDSVAVRVIDHPLVKQLCAHMVSASNPYGFVVSTSCNPSGQSPALSLSEAQRYFLSDNENSNECVGYLKGETLGYQLPSQIGDALTGQIIR
ncbi:MAG TPA: Sua5/YciO/YrdC/YwlC family protein [Psychrobacter sp.]|uniref:L-threonylcarbamoyladenylate synthase n=1 Tax=Psychrobacter sp. TaxID=56811 RepID=UPI002C06F9D5|nr:Sua5/YciO/YrdC/YwlC family protein [Psychrobacter sp.]HSP85278.1 Sua5/YciO/YrdC/YwlC family protein [Psychrobacter sp.]